MEITPWNDPRMAIGKSIFHKDYPYTLYSIIFANDEYVGVVRVYGDGIELRGSIINYKELLTNYAYLGPYNSHLPCGYMIPSNTAKNNLKTKRIKNNARQ